MRHTGAEGGSASVWLLAVGGVVALSTALAVSMGAAIVVRHRAAAAADLAALAAVTSEGCVLAANVVVEAGATVQSCHDEAGIYAVTVRMALPGRLRPFGPVVATARAGRAPVGSLL